MKKVIALCLVLISIVSLCACGGEKQNNTQTNETSQQVDNGPAIESEARKYIPMFYNRTGHKERWDFIDENENCFPFLNQNQIKEIFNNKNYLRVTVSLLLNSDGTYADESQKLYNFNNGTKTELGRIETNSLALEQIPQYKTQYVIENGYFCEEEKFSVQKITEGYYLIKNPYETYIYGESDENGKLIYDCSEGEASIETIDSSITLEKWAKNNPFAQDLLKQSQQDYGNGTTLEVTINDNTLLYTMVFENEIKDKKAFEDVIAKTKDSLEKTKDTWIETCNSWAEMSKIENISLKYQYRDSANNNGDITSFQSNVDLGSVKEEWENDVQDSIDEKKEANAKPKIGMTAEQVRKGKWGYPDKINKHTYSWGVQEQWVYNDYGYVYFEDGIVTSVTEKY